MTYILKSTDPATVAAAKANLAAVQAQFDKMAAFMDEVTERYGQWLDGPNRGVYYRSFFHTFLVKGIQGGPDEEKPINDGWRYDARQQMLVPNKRTTAGREWAKRLTELEGSIAWDVPGVLSQLNSPRDENGRSVWYLPTLFVSADKTTAYYQLEGETAISEIAKHQECTGEDGGWVECLLSEFHSALEAVEATRFAPQPA